MAELYDETAHTTITNLVESFELLQEISQILSYAIDGTPYMQIIGSPRKTYSVSCHATRAQTTLIETAQASGNLLRISMTEGNATRYGYGRIIELNKELIQNVFDGTTRQDYYKVELKLTYATSPSSQSSPT